MKRKLLCMAIALALCLGLLPGTALAEEGDTLLIKEGAIPEETSVSEAIEDLNLTGEGIEEPFDFSSETDTIDELATKGYKWEVTENLSEEEGKPPTYTYKLILNNAVINDTVTLPAGDVTIDVTGECGIKELKVNAGDSTHLTVSGTGKLTVEEKLEISNGNDPSLTVDSGANLEAKKRVSVGSGGGANGTIIVHGTLTAAGSKEDDSDSEMPAVSAGKVAVGGTGKLEVSGKTGVSLGGMTKFDDSGSPTDFDGAFTLGEGGSFTANGTENAILVTNFNGESLEGTDPNEVIVVPPGYLPAGHEQKLSDDKKAIVVVGGEDFTINKDNVKYTITVIPGDHGTASASAPSATAGTQITLTATANEGYTFSGWTSNDVTITDGAFAMPEKDVAITANWTANSTWVPSGPAAPTTYPVRTDTPENGAVTVTPRNAARGRTVTVTAAPEEGYQLDKLTVTDSGGNEVELTGQGDGSYTFTMPGRGVTVKAEFRPAEEPPEEGPKPCDGGEDCPSRAFPDLDTGEWYHEAADYVLKNGLMDGYGNGLFGPEDNLSRAQLAQIFCNIENRPSVAGGNIFTDVIDDWWYTPAIVWAEANGIVNGYGNGRFGPDDNITREQLAVMLWRYRGSPAPAGRGLPFTDADQAGDWAWDALCWAVENGILNGCGGGRLEPQGLATRAQAAQMLKNYMGQ